MNEEEGEASIPNAPFPPMVFHSLYTSPLWRRPLIPVREERKFLLHALIHQSRRVLRLCPFFYCRGLKS